MIPEGYEVIIEGLENQYEDHDSGMMKTSFYNGDVQSMFEDRRSEGVVAQRLDENGQWVFSVVPSFSDRFKFRLLAKINRKETEMQSKELVANEYYDEFDKATAPDPIPPIEEAPKVVDPLDDLFGAGIEPARPRPYVLPFKQEPQPPGPHKWAEVLIAIANGIAVEFKTHHGEWYPPESRETNPITCSHWEWRVKPQTFTVEPAELPQSESKELRSGDNYFTVDFGGRKIHGAIWNDDSADDSFLRKGNVYLKESDAQEVLEWFKRTMEKGRKS